MGLASPLAAPFPPAFSLEMGARGEKEKVAWLLERSFPEICPREGEEMRDCRR